MHTSQWHNKAEYYLDGQISKPGDEVYIHHNGDWSGDAIINVPTELYERMIDSAERRRTSDGEWGRVEFRLPGRMLAEMGRQTTIDEIVSKLQDMA